MKNFNQHQVEMKKKQFSRAMIITKELNQYYVLYLTLISSQVFLRRKSSDYPFGAIQSEPYKDFKGALRYFAENHTGRDEDLFELAAYAHFNKEYEDLIYAIITKDIKIGVQPTTLNKAFGKGFINTFDVMLGTKYFDNPDKLVKDGDVLFENLDYKKILLLGIVFLIIGCFKSTWAPMVGNVFNIPVPLP